MCGEQGEEGDPRPTAGDHQQHTPQQQDTPQQWQGESKQHQQNTQQQQDPPQQWQGERE